MTAYWDRTLRQELIESAAWAIGGKSHEPNVARSIATARQIVMAAATRRAVEYFTRPVDRARQQNGQPLAIRSTAWFRPRSGDRVGSRRRSATCQAGRPGYPRRRG